MFERDLDKVYEYVKRIGACYLLSDLNGDKKIYIFDKKIYVKKHKDLHKYKDLYVPYIRISDNGGDGLYTRRDGYVEEMTDEKIKEVIDELTNG